MSDVKPFKTIDEQIKILKDRKLIIKDEDIEKAKNFLINNNYYRISGYSLTLRRSDIFFDNISIENIIQIYETDKRMRHIILSTIELVETRLKSLISYFHSEKHGPLGYLDINNFNCVNTNKVDMTVVNNYLQITRKADQQQNLSYDSELFVKHHKDNKDGMLPFWVYIELLTISDVSKLYTMLDYKCQ